MTGIVGSVWKMRDNLTDISWSARTPIDEASLGIDDPLLSLSWEREMRKALAVDLLTGFPTAPDVYGFGKEVARMARLALIADELGERESGRLVVLVFFVIFVWIFTVKEDCRGLRTVYYFILFLSDGWVKQ